MKLIDSNIIIYSGANLRLSAALFFLFGSGLSGLWPAMKIAHELHELREKKIK